MTYRDLAKKMDRILIDSAGLRHDMAVLIAVARHAEHNAAVLLSELRAMNSEASL